MNSDRSIPSATPSAPTLEYTCSVCTCGRELSTIYYFLTVRSQFLEFAREYGLNSSGSSSPFLDQISLLSLQFCCLKNLRYGIRASVATIPSSETGQTRRYPETLPGPLSRERVLSW